MQKQTFIKLLCVPGLHVPHVTFGMSHCPQPERQQLGTFSFECCHFAYVCCGSAVYVSNGARVLLLSSPPVACESLRGAFRGSFPEGPVSLDSSGPPAAADSFSPAHLGAFGAVLAVHRG